MTRYFPFSCIQFSFFRSTVTHIVISVYLVILHYSTQILLDKRPHSVGRMLSSKSLILLEILLAEFIQAQSEPRSKEDGKSTGGGRRKEGGAGRGIFYNRKNTNTRSEMFRPLSPPTPGANCPHLTNQSEPLKLFSFGAY